jgi:uncharacterized protein
MSYALITGASSGLGVSLARIFAEHKTNLVLVARRADKLEAVANELRATGVKVEIIAADLAAPAAAAEICAELERRQITIEILVNNAGVGSTGKYWELPVTGEVAQMQLNVIALAELTHRLLPAMVAKRKGRILNIGSTAGFQPGPYMATYYATKAFVSSFTEALAAELRGSGVTATVSCPGAFASEFSTVSGNGKNSLFTKNAIATADAIAAEAFAAMMRGDSMVVHGVKLKLALFAARFAPRSFSTRIAESLNLP